MTAEQQTAFRPCPRQNTLGNGEHKVQRTRGRLTRHVPDVVLVVHQGSNLLYGEFHHGAWSLKGRKPRQLSYYRVIMVPATTCTFYYPRRRSSMQDAVATLHSRCCKPSSPKTLGKTWHANRSCNSHIPSYYLRATCASRSLRKSVARCSAGTRSFAAVRGRCQVSIADLINAARFRLHMIRNTVRLQQLASSSQNLQVVPSNQQPPASARMTCGLAPVLPRCHPV